MTVFNCTINSLLFKILLYYKNVFSLSRFSTGRFFTVQVVLLFLSVAPLWEEDKTTFVRHKYDGKVNACFMCLCEHPVLS